MKLKLALVGVMLPFSLANTNAPQTPSPYAQHVQQMIVLIKEAAQKEILPRQQHVNPEVKETRGWRDLVTAADKEASRYILDHIRPTLPGSYSEEHKFEDRFDHDLIWQIDPVDGTQEFCEGFAEGYTVLAALLKRQPDGTYDSVAGIIYRPALDVMWYCDGSNKVHYIRDGKEQPLPIYQHNEILVYQRRVDHFSGINEFLPYLDAQFHVSARTVEAGGSGASIADLLEEKINLLFFNSNFSKDWDIGMAVPIIKALGGFVCDIDGNEMTYNRPDAPELCEPYNLRGYAASIVFKKEEIVPVLKFLKMDDRLSKKK